MLNTNYLENNHITLVGKVTSEKKFSHEVYGEKFYLFDLSVPRLSGNSDVIPVTISERISEFNELVVGKNISVSGQFRSYNTYVNNRNKLMLTVFAKEVIISENQEEEFVPSKEVLSNEVILTGYICKKPIYRKTPFGREIADLLLAVNRAYNKSDYIPCIAWGRNAKFCENIEVGTEVKVSGRVQSRQYEKKYEDGTVETKVAYEVSIGSMQVIEKDAEETVENQETETVETNEAM